MGKFCVKCGAPLNSGPFCVKCGADMRSVGTPASQSPVSVVQMPINRLQHRIRCPRSKG